MILFDASDRGSDEPPWFRSKEVGQARQRIEDYLALPEDELAQTDPPPVWKLPTDSGRERGAVRVIEVLLRRSQNLCAFCESARESVVPYRFRPPAFAHGGGGDRPEPQAYLRRAFLWSNYFPICSGCLPTDKSFFPVDGARYAMNVDDGSDTSLKKEHALLYHPGELVNPATAFGISLDGRLVGKNQRAVTTIETFRLNRASVVSEREEQLAIVRDAMMAMVADGQPLGGYLPYLTGTRPFGGALFLFLRQVFSRLLPKVPMRGGLSRKTIDQTAASILANPRARELLREDQSLFDDPEPEPLQATRGGQGPRNIDAETIVDTSVSLTHPRIKSVEIQTFKSLERIAFDMAETLPRDPDAILHEASMTLPSAPCLLILGENATGKSSILEAITLACLTDELRDGLTIPEVGLRPHHLTLNPDYLGAEGRPPFEDATATITFHPDRSEKDAAQAERVMRLMIHREDPGTGRMVADDNRDTALPLVFAYGPNRIYNNIPVDRATCHVDTMFNTSLLLPNPEDWLKSIAHQDSAMLDDVVKALRHIIQIDGEFHNIEVKADPADGNRERVWINLKRDRPDGTQQRLCQRLAYASSGYRAVLALVCDVLARILEAGAASIHAARTSNAIILIDEIEAHLHPRWKMQIIGGLRRALPNATFIVTSHDPLCVRGMKSGEVMMLNRFMTGNADIPEAVERIDQFGAFEHMTVEQLLTSDMFQLANVDDPRAEARYARIADLLAKREREDGLTVAEKEEIAEFNAEIVAGMPTGVTEVTNVVQNAVAEYLKARRRGDQRTTKSASASVTNTVREFLDELLR